MDEPITTVANEPNVDPVVNPAPANEPKPFKVYATQEEWDREMGNARKQGIKQGEKNALSTIKDGEIDREALIAQVKKEITPIIAKEAVEKYKKQQAMTEAEKLEEARKEAMETLRQKEIELNRREAQFMMKSAGFNDARIDMELEFINDDRETSLSRIQRLCDMDKSDKETMRKSILNDLAVANPSIKVGTGEANSLQAEYDTAKQRKDVASMVRIITQAQKQGINLKQ